MSCVDKSIINKVELRETTKARMVFLQEQISVAADEHEESEGKQCTELLTAAGLLSVTLVARGTKTLEGARNVEALGVGAAGSGQPTLIDVRACLFWVASKARRTHTLVRAMGVHAGGCCAAWEGPVGWLSHGENCCHLHLVLLRVDALVNILLVRHRRISMRQPIRCDTRPHLAGYWQALVLLTYLLCTMHKSTAASRTTVKED